MFKIITKASRHMCSLYAYITSLQHNIISNFFVMKYNLPTNWLFLLSLEAEWKYVCYHSFLQWFINKFLYDFLVFLSFLSAYSLSLHCLTTVRCMVKNECQRENHFQSWNKCIFNENLRKSWLEFSVNIL